MPTGGRYTECEVFTRDFAPASSTLRPKPFDSDDYIFELKMDGFRALAHVGPDEIRTRLISRRRATCTVASQN
jgi:ATP-dependent DNA ligase